MDLDDFTADELLDLLLDFNVTEEWQLLSIRDHWKQQYKNICSLFASDKVELNKRLLRLNKAYNVFTSIEQDQRRQLYLRFRSLLLSDQIDLLEQINDSDQPSVDPDFLKNSRNLKNIADQKQRQYEITKERRRRELEEAAAWKADREIDAARRRSQEEFVQSNSHEQSMSSSTDDASDRTSVNNETHSQPAQGVDIDSRDDRKSYQQSPKIWYKSKLAHLILLLGTVWTALFLVRIEYQRQNSSFDIVKGKLSRVVQLHKKVSGSEKDVIRLTTEILATHQIDTAYYYRAHARTALGYWKEAIDDCNKYLATNSDSPDCYYLRGKAKGFLDDKQGEIADYDQAIAIYPNYADAYMSRGKAKGFLGDKHGAIADYNQAIAISLQLDMLDVHDYITRGNAKKEVGDKQGAISDYSEYIARYPQNADVYILRSSAYSDIGDNFNSCKDWRKAVSLDKSKYYGILRDC